MILEGEDATDWIYRGEGAANLVLAYRGSSPQFIGKVLRVQKVSRNEPKSKESNLVMSMHEHLVWEDVDGLVRSTSKEALGQLYVQHVMKPLLGSEHVDAGMHVLVSKEFLESVEKNVLTHRPSCRVDAAKVNTLCTSALLISDHSGFPQGSLKDDICIAVEIKPKCGFLPSSRFITEGNAVKKSISRFRMHQFLKLHKKEVSGISDYDPLDLFSGSKERIIQAVTTLFITPQNNFRIFINGSLIYGGLGGIMGEAKSKECYPLEDMMKGVIHAEHGQHLSRFLELVSETIFQTGLMDGLLKAQKLDHIDIEGAIHAYYDIISEPCMVCKSFGDVDLRHEYSLLHSLSLQESVKIVRDYLIAATAKDCSLMICFRPRGSGNLASETGSLFLESTNQTFDYKAHFIDLDMKLLNKMVYYYKLDQNIVSCYKKDAEFYMNIETVYVHEILLLPSVMSDSFNDEWLCQHEESLHSCMKKK